MSLTWYRFRATLRQRLPGYVSIVALTALLGGLAMGALAAARRTSSSYSTFLAKTDPSDLSLGTALFNPALGYVSGYDPNLVRIIARLPDVQRVESDAGLSVFPLGPDNAPTAAALNANYTPFGSVDGEYFDQDRATAVQGRLPDPARPDEFAITAQLARELGLRVGQAVRLGIYTTAQSVSPQFGTAAVAPHASLTAQLVGVVVFNHAVVQDDVDAANDQYLLFTPAFTAPVAKCCTYFTFSDLRPQHGARDVPAVEASIQRDFPQALPFDPRPTSVVRAKTQRAIQPAAVALAVFGAIVALAGLVVVGQVIGRQLASDTVDTDVLRALGAGPVVTASARVAGLLGAAVVGAALAVVAALALSPLAPLGPVRPVYPHRGISADWVVLGGGFAVVVAALAALALVLAWRQAPHRVMGTARHRARLPRASRRLPVAAATGLRFSMDTGDQRTAVGMRSAVLGTALAVTVVTGAVTFGSSLSTLISHPALYGWSWDYALDGGGGAGAVPGTASSRLLGANPDVAAWSPVYFANLQIDGQTVPVLGADPRAAVAPPVLSGRGLEATDQIVLGATTLASLHKHIGDSVDVRYGVANPTPLRIVGTASLPALGIGGVEVTHLSMSTGALLAYGLIPASVRNSFGNSPPGPNAILIRARPGAPRGRLLASLTRMASQLSLPTNYGVTVLGVQRPAEIVNYRSMRATPAYLAAGLGLGAVGGLGLTLIATVRRRRRDLAVLKTLGFTRRQLGSVIAWQSTFAVLTGTVVGLPLGIAAGRTLWDAFATAIGAVPTPRVPGVTIAAIGVGALALGNLVTLVPARLASHVPAALALRAE